MSAPRGGCVFCTYEADAARGAGGRRVPRVRRTARTVETANGPRDLCAPHAESLPPLSLRRRSA